MSVLLCHVLSWCILKKMFCSSILRCSSLYYVMLIHYSMPFYVILSMLYYAILYCCDITLCFYIILYLVLLHFLLYFILMFVVLYYVKLFYNT